MPGELSAIATAVVGVHWPGDRIRRSLIDVIVSQAEAVRMDNPWLHSLKQGRVGDDSVMLRLDQSSFPKFQ